ncbi:hypothetical protein [Caenimonas sp. SL110]|uniref:hypothetical protein n=1 Tax=Caenimonas sp. SL110 TaxID=1450524 RepID=UPI00069F6A33|nr:hypothetical protein [Caenimonas sp. SL110]
MDIPQAEPLGPPSFRFVPRVQPMRVRAFSLPFRLLATVMVFGIEVWMYVLWQAGQLSPPGLSTAAALGWPLAAVGIMLYTWWHIVTSRTTLTPTALHQSWMWDKKMELGELAYGKLIRVPGLDWLIAPRLYVRTLLGKFAVFYAADAAMLAEFERLIAELKAFRGFR